MRAFSIAPTHITHGSSVTKIATPSSRYDLSSAAAARSATISACAVGSLSAIGQLWPAPTIRPSSTAIAPTGTSPAAAARRASSSASPMNLVSSAILIGAASLPNEQIDIARPPYQDRRTGDAYYEQAHRDRIFGR